MKKYIFSILAIVIYAICCNFVNASVVVTENKISYLTTNENYTQSNGSNSDANKKVNTYGTIIQNKIQSSKAIDGWTKADGTQRYTTNWYLKYIYKEEINGYEAFCLDPGLGIDNSYVVADANDEDFKALYNRKDELAAIYDFNYKTTLYYKPNTVDGNLIKIRLNDDDIYLIKQLFFWYSSNLAKNRPYHKVIRDGQVANTGWYYFGYRWDTVTEEYYFFDELLMLFEDICNGVLHNHQRTDSSLVSIPDTAYESTFLYYMGDHTSSTKYSPYELNMQTFRMISQKLSENLNKYKGKEDEIKLSLFKPKSGSASYQRFVGIDVPPIDKVDPEEKYYAVVVNKEGTLSTTTNYTKFTNEADTSAPTVSGYEYTGQYRVYNSQVSYDGDPKTLANGSRIERGSKINGSSYKFKYNDSKNYNVVEYIYKKPEPKYNLNVEYYYKSASESTYTKLGTGTSQTHTKGSKITPISTAYNSTYDSTLFVKAEIFDGTNTTALTASNGEVSCSMPGSNATIRIYYQYGQVAVSKYVRFNDGSKKQIGDTLKYNLTSDQNITLSESISHDGTTYYYFKFIKNGGTSYYNASGCSAGSSVKNSKGKSNVTIDIYYGLRRIDYAHKIVDGPTIESNKIYRYEGDGKVKWGEDKQILTAKTTPLYTKINNYEYVKLNYKNYSSKSGPTIIAESSVTFSTSGNTNKTFDLAALGAKENDSTRVHFYYEKIESTKVVVRHFVKQSNGTYVRNDSLANPKTGVQNVEKEYGTVKKGQGIVVNNKYSQRKSVVNGKIDTLTDYEIKAIYTGSYSEFYEIDKNDSITIDRSRVLISDGIYYKCEGFSLLKSSNTPIKTNPLGENNISSSKAIKDKRLSQTITGNDYVFIDYYYEPVSYSTNVESIGNSARLKYMPKAAGTYSSLGNNNSVVNSTTSGAKESDNIAYVPVTENLKPYVVTDKFRVRTAIYDIDNEGKYTVGSYQTWAVSDDSNMASVGSVVGNGNNLVYDANKGSLNVSDVNTLRSERAATYDVVKSIKNAFEGNATSAHTTFNSILTNVASAKTNEAFYSDSANYNISSTKYNGLRNTTGSINYKVYNVTSSSSSSAAKGNEPWTITTDNSMSVNIYTPATVADAKIKSIDFVNHSNSNSVSIIQQGVTFSVTVSAKKDTAYSSNVYNQITNTGKYIKYWYLMFDFDVAYNGVTYGANTPILVNAANNAYAETTISGLHAVTTSTDRELVESTLNHIKVIAGTANLPSQDYARTQLGRTDAKKVDTSTKHIDNLYVKQRTSASSPQSQSDGLGMQYDSYYLVSNVQENLSVGRIFDFEITDCLDVNFKDVFRILTSEEEIKNSTYSPINVLTGTRYFSGIRRLMVTDSVTSSTTNNLVNRGNLDAGAVKKILPLGPYKHTTNTYIKAVKLGYRFSFDLKTSGYYSPKENTSIERYVKVTPSYYYISKDGKTYNDNIKLYYKNSSGKYVDFETSNYTIYYKPDDGYRNLYNSSTYQETDVSKTTKDGVTTLTSSLVGLKIGSNQGFTLSDTKSMTISDAGYLQAWYGEFKLPNSTVALAVDASGNVDINNPLTNGYIGVKFNLECVDTYTNNRTVTISYNSQDKGLGNNQVNTSQWDYEGYLGFKNENIGKELQNNINIQLENGVWSVDANTYKAIKGTVIFYDLDDRAANDYD